MHILPKLESLQAELLLIVFSGRIGYACSFHCNSRNGSEGVADVVAVAAGAVAGDEFADEAGEEEHHAHEDGDEGQVEEWLVGDRAEIQPVDLMDYL